MKRRSFLKQAAAGVAVGAVAAPAIAQSSPSIQWRMAASWPKSLDTLFGGAELVCNRVAELTWVLYTGYRFHWGPTEIGISLAFVGVICPRKGLDLLADAIAGVQSRDW